MDHLDVDRWLSLIAAYKNALDSAPAFSLLQDAQGRWARARADLETFEARGAIGQRDQRSNPAIQQTFQRDVDELTARVASADAEVRRIQTLQGKANERLKALRQLLDGVRAWARAQSPPMALPGDDEISMGGFGASSVHIASPQGPPGREFAPSVASRQGAITAAAEPPMPRVHRGTSGVVTMMTRVSP